VRVQASTLPPLLPVREDASRKVSPGFSAIGAGVP